MSLFRMSLVASVIAAVMALGDKAHAQPAEEFYKGRDVRIVIPAGMGGSFGLYGQLVAKHLGKHLPGNPNLITQAMPGAGGLTALTYVYNAAPKDGSVLMLPHSGVVFETVLNPEARFDAANFQYIGRLASADNVGLVQKRVGINSTEEALTKELTFGATGPANTTAIMAEMFNRMAGGKINIITGYAGLANVFQAVEQGEVDGVAATVVNPNYLAFLKKVASGEPTDFVPIFTSAHERLPELPGVPTLAEFDASEEDRNFYGVVSADGLIGRTIAFPPGVPAEYVEAFRKGFDAMVRDPEFIADTTERGIPIAVMSGEQLGRLIDEILAATPPERRPDVMKTYKEVLAAIEG